MTRRVCISDKCNWVGDESDCVHPKHWPDDRLCPECYEKTELEENELTPKKFKSRAYINGVLFFDIVTPAPNAFRRFWYWALLGWTWASLE